MAVIISYVVIGLINFQKGDIISVSDNHVYISGEFSEYDGGEQAADFFPSYENIDGNIDFAYLDLRNQSNYFHEYCSSYVLDIYYTDDYKLQESVEQISKEKESFVNDFILLYEEREKGKIKLITYNEDKKLIRYVFLYGDIIDLDVDSRALIARNTECSW